MQCKTAEHAKVFGIFDKMYVHHRDSGRFKFQDCTVEANNNIEQAVYCVRDYVKHIKDDNEKMIDLFKRDYAKYV